MICESTRTLAHPYPHHNSKSPLSSSHCTTPVTNLILPRTVIVWFQPAEFLLSSNLHRDQLIVARLIRLCSSYGKLEYAYLVLEHIENPSSFSWNLLIRAHTVNGRSVRAVLLYNLMIFRGANVDKFTLPFVMKACLASGFVEKAKEVYGLYVKTGLWQDLYLTNVLMDVFFKYGVLDDGLNVFDKMRHRSVVSWTTLIAGVVFHGRMDLAQKMFDKMPVKHVVSWTTMISGYAKPNLLQLPFNYFVSIAGEG